MSINFVKLVNNNIISKEYLRYFKDRKIYFFLLGLSGTIGDFEIVFVTVIFVLTMTLSYRFKYQYLYKYFSGLVNQLNPEHKKLFYSVITAGCFSLSSYFILNIWTELDNKWLALGIISQIILSGAGLLFLTNNFLKNKKQNTVEKNPLDDIVNHLDSPSPLKRLWAINQILRRSHLQQLTLDECGQIQEYLTIMRDLETDPIILNKIDEYLTLMSPVLCNPLQMPIKPNIVTTKAVLEKVEMNSK